MIVFAIASVCINVVNFAKVCTSAKVRYPIFPVVSIFRYGPPSLFAHALDVHRTLLSLLFPLRLSGVCATPAGVCCFNRLPSFAPPPFILS